jgi:hypothetical protein
VRSIGTTVWARTINASHSYSIGFQINGEKETLIAAEITPDKVAGEAIKKLRRYGGCKVLDEEAHMRELAPG